MSLQINKAILTLLKANASITALAGNRLYPIVATHEDTLMPFIVFKRKSIVPSYSKDGHVADACTVTITVLSKDYSESVTLLQAVRTTLEDRRGEFAGIMLTSCRVVAATEMCDGETYVQELTFDIDTQ